ncbi:MAG: hypothetical protein IT436_02860 [Phycisphaerales bacterium]|nr:hypothetical protein [Phycisphaerales bacterium]
MKASKILLAVGLAVVATGTASATVRETFTLAGLPSEGTSATGPLAGSGMFTAVGGYSLGRIDVTGTLTSTGIGSWGSESRIRVQSPLGGFLDVQPFPSVGTTYTSLAFSGSIYVAAGADPIGGWTVRTFESFDDSGGVDANWDSLEFRFTDEPPAAPGALDLGTLSSGLTTAAGTLSSTNRVQWYKFTTAGDASAGLGTFLDVDTEGTALTPSNDTEIGLFDSFGTLVGTDDDDGSGLLSQLTFGAGTRPAVGTGMAYNGRDGTLAAGTYYLAVASFNSTFAAGFTVTPGTANTGPFAVNINTTAVPAPGTLALVMVGGLVSRRRRA